MSFVEGLNKVFFVFLSSASNHQPAKDTSQYHIYTKYPCQSEENFKYTIKYTFKIYGPGCCRIVFGNMNGIENDSQIVTEDSWLNEPNPFNNYVNRSLQGL